MIIKQNYSVITPFAMKRGINGIPRGTQIGVKHYRPKMNRRQRKAIQRRQWVADYMNKLINDYTLEEWDKLNEAEMDRRTA